MTPENLKASILQYAIQGKLVEQRVEEGMADEYVSKVCKLLKTNRRIIDDDEKYIDIPQSWTWACVSDLTTDEYVNDGNWVLSKDMVAQGEVKLIQLGSIGDNQYKEKGFKYLTYEHFKELNGRQIYPGYLLINRLIGDKMLSCILPDLDGILMTAVDVCWIAPHEECYDLKFLMYAMASSLFQGKVKELGRGTTRFRISKLNLINIAFPLPPLEEQHRIVTKIEELLPYVNRYAKAYEKLEQFNAKFPENMKRSILQYAIQGKLVEQRSEEGTAEELYQQIQDEKKKLIKEKGKKKEKVLEDITDEEIPFDIPENWKWVRLGDIIYTTEAGKSPNCINQESKDGEWGVIKTTAIQDGFFLCNENKVLPESFEIRPEYIIEKGDFLITRAGPRNRTGVMCVVKDEVTKLILSDKTVRICYPKGLMDPEYMMYALSSPACQKDIETYMTGMASSQVNISQGNMRKFIFPLAPVNEQKRIVIKIKELLQYCTNL